MLTHYTTAQEIAILKPRLIDDGVLTNNDSGPKKMFYTQDQHNPDQTKPYATNLMHKELTQKLWSQAGF